MTNNTDTQGAAMTLEKALAAFGDALLGKNRSAATLRAYRTDILQFMAFLKENNVALTVRSFWKFISKNWKFSFEEQRTSNAGSASLWTTAHLAGKRP